MIAFERWIRTHYIPTILQTDNGTEFKNKTMNQFYQENNIQQVYGVPYNPQHQGAVEAFNRTVQDFLTQARDHQGDSYNLEDSISDFLLSAIIENILQQKLHLIKQWWI